MSLQHKIKCALIKELNLQGMAPSDINDDAPLFNEGLGLDSLDAVEIVVLVQNQFGVVIKDMDEGREALRSVNALADFIAKRTGGA